MASLLSLGGSLGAASAAFLLVILGVLSARLGAVLRLPPHYRWFYAAAALAAVACAASLAHAWLGADPAQAAWLATPAAEILMLFLDHLPLAVGLTVGLAVGWRYWSWLLGQG
jgi:hypothetical protein